MISLSPYHFEM